MKPELLESVKNRIILIGISAPSTSDLWETPFSAKATDGRTTLHVEVLRKS
ncbi:MAG TPA: hypothetical protein DCE56_03875 [Cyanobacteria bacterium UBA8553]|nr:hypothetical protein [Cyanobacteria bacterium UBA8553]HAJ61652.1 hypothetical protein [Cyanobacteria bacterium UBA8543]